MAKKVRHLPVGTIVQEKVNSIVSRNVLNHGAYINSARHIMHLDDGMKPSYLYIMDALREHPSSTFIKTETLLGYVGGRYSPHNTDALASVVNSLVSVGIIEGRGNFGANSVFTKFSGRAAAPRYTDIRLAPKWRKVLDSLVPYIPRVDTELEYTRPEYLPTPVPISCIIGGLGIGIGAKSETPNFSLESMIAAYKANNTALLEPAGEVKRGVFINRRSSELDKIWNEGRGKVTYQHYLDEDFPNPTNPKLKGYIIRGEPTFYQSVLQYPLVKKLDPDTKKFIDGWFELGYIDILDRSTDSVAESKVFIGVTNKKNNPVTDDMLRREIEKVRKVSIPVDLMVYGNGVTKRISLRDWIGVTLNNLSSLLQMLKTDKLAKIALEELVTVNARAIVEELQKAYPKDISNEEIAKKLGISNEVVDKAMEKRISTLRKLKVEEILEGLKKDKEYYTNLTVESLYESLY